MVSRLCAKPGILGDTPGPPTKSLGFEGFDSNELLILKGGNYHIHIIVQGVSRKVYSRTLSRETRSRWTGRMSVGRP